MEGQSLWEDSRITAVEAAVADLIAKIATLKRKVLPRFFNTRLGFEASHLRLLVSKYSRACVRPEHVVDCVLCN